MSKAEDYRRWLARRWFRTGFSGWTSCGGIGTDTKKAKAVLAKWLRDGYVEADRYGMYRVTELGRDKLFAEQVRRTIGASRGQDQTGPSPRGRERVS